MWKCGLNKTALQWGNWKELQKYVVKIVGFFIIFVENIVQSCWNKHDFVYVLKHPAFFEKLFADHEILSACKNEVEVWKYVKKMVGLFISFVANVAQSCGNE